MADSLSSTAAKKSKSEGRGTLKRLLGWVKRPKSANASASQPNSTRVSVSSASDAHDPGPGIDAESAEPSPSGGNATPHQARSPSSSVPDLLGSAMGQGHGRETSLTTTPAEPASTNPQMPVSDWKATAKEGLGVASRFTQTLLKKLPACVETNPVKMALSIAKAIIEIKDAVGDNKDELAQCVKQTANRLLAVERTVAIGVPKAAEQEMEKLKQILQEEMKKLEDLAHKSPAIRTLDHEEDNKKILQIFRHVNDATTSFQFEMANSIQETANMILDETKKRNLDRLRPSEKADHKTVLEHEALKREECTPGTRVKILEDITNWANNHSPDSARVFWLTGQAGSGKTTIAYTIAKRFENGGGGDQHTVLGGNFLCSRQFEETRERTRIIPTIAYQLARKCPSYADALHVNDKFDAVNHDISTQLKDLLVGPWQQSEATRGPELPPHLIIVDALDEIKGDGGTVFLSNLLKAINEYDLRGLKFLVTSRPDPKVVTLCESFASEAVCRLQDVPIEEVKSDIETYLKAKLPKLASSPELAELGRRAGGLFIYVATAVKYLTRRVSITAGVQTEMLNDLLSKSYEPASASKATFLIDELYRRIMCDAFSELEGKFLTRRLRILYTFLCTVERTSTSIVAALISDVDDEARAVLRNLHAVLYTQDDRVYWYHTSFPDFIFDRDRAKESWCDQAKHHQLLTDSCFRIVDRLKFNIANITSSFLLDRDNSALPDAVKQNIPPVLSYSCRHWDYHLSAVPSTDSRPLCGILSKFLQLRVLFWIEAMNLLGSRGLCDRMLQTACKWVTNDDSILGEDFAEAASFALYFRGSEAALSTPHLYISALATWPQVSGPCQEWRSHFPGIPHFANGLRGGMPLMTLTVASPVNAVAFSSDDRCIISGSWDKLVQVWDASTGETLKVLEGHTGEVMSVAFSSDDRFIVSGSSDKSVRVCDASTGETLKVLEGHTDLVMSVAFSSDDRHIISGSFDELVQVWDALTGETLKVLEGHTGEVMSVAFSSDDRRTVSGSLDKWVWVRDASTGKTLKVLEGHTGEVMSVAFSSDDRCIVSGSWAKSVWVWDASMGETLKVLEGHTNLVMSAAFLSDDRSVIAGSDDKSVRMWAVPTQQTSLRYIRQKTVDSSGNQRHTGWLLSLEGDYLMFVPLSVELPDASNILTLPRSYAASVDFTSSTLGPEWHKCFFS